MPRKCVGDPSRRTARTPRRRWDKNFEPPYTSVTRRTIPGRALSRAGGSGHLGSARGAPEVGPGGLTRARIGGIPTSPWGESTFSRARIPSVWPRVRALAHPAPVRSLRHVPPRSAVSRGIGGGGRARSRTRRSSRWSARSPPGRGRRTPVRRSRAWAPPWPRRSRRWVPSADGRPSSFAGAGAARPNGAPERCGGGPGGSAAVSPGRPRARSGQRFARSPRRSGSSP